MLGARLVHFALIAGLPLAVSFTWAQDALAPKQALWLLAGALLLVTPPIPDLRRSLPAAALLAVAAAGCLRAGPSPFPLGPWLVGVILYLRAASLGSDDRFLRRAVRWSVAVATLVALNGLSQAVWNRVATEVRLVNPFGVRVLSTLGNPTFLADYLALHLPLAMHLAAAATSAPARSAWSAASLLIGIVTVLSGSKGGMLAAATGIAVWAAGAVARRELGPRRLLAGAAGTVIAGGLAVAVLPGGLEAVGRWTSAAERFSFSQRWLILRGTAALVADAPLLGHGTGSFPAVFPRVQPAPLSRELGVGLSVNHAHLDWLEVAADLGLPALALAGWLLFAGLRRWREPGPVGALAAAQAAAAVSMTTNFVLFLPSSAFFVWVHAGYLAPRGDPAPGRIPLPPRFGAYLALFLLVAAGRTLVGTANLHWGVAAVDRGDGIASERWLDRAVRLMPANRHAWQYLGRSHEIRGDLDRSLQAYERALALGPWHAITWLNVGRLERQRYLDHRILRHGSRNRAVAALRRCVEANPYLLEPRIWGGELAVDAGRGDDAQALLGAHPPDFPGSARWHRTREHWLLAQGNTRAAAIERGKADEYEGREQLAAAERDLAAGRHAAAIRAVERITARLPRFAPAWELIGFAKHQLRDAAGARAAFMRLGELLPDSLTAQLNLAMLALNANQPAAAERYLRRAEAIAPDGADVHLGYARLRVLQGRRAEAIAAYERCLTLRPEHPEAGPELRRLTTP